MTRREFLKKTSILSLALTTCPFSFKSTCSSEILGKQGYLSPKEARYYQSLEKQMVQCALCPRRCLLASGQRSFCRARKNQEGKLITLVYGNPCAVHLDPIEKKPLFHFLPGTTSLSLAAAGCNLRCNFCQNWQISQSTPEETMNFPINPDQFVKAALAQKSPSIAFTYTEPTIFFEYMLDIAKLAKEKGLKVVEHSNGFINPEPLKELCKYLDAANVDLKGWTDKYYNEMCSAWIEPVKNTLKTLKKEGVHLEITTLVVTNKNDDLEVVKKMCLWIKNELGDDVPLHFARFFPYYKLEYLPAPPVHILETLREVAFSAGLKYVYIGNVPGHSGESTYCHHCSKIIIKRFGFKVIENNIVDGKCKFCKQVIPGVWDKVIGDRYRW
ncbi:MAG: AmmeMemoRadiSam system radical SAM enzyme [Nitrospirota bacterium]